MLAATRHSAFSLSRAGAWNRWQVSSAPAIAIHTSSLAKFTKGDGKYNNSAMTNALIVCSTVLHSARNFDYMSSPNLNRSSSIFLSKGYASTAMETKNAHPPGVRFKFRHEPKDRICKTLNKRNIMDHKRRLLARKYELRRKLYKAGCRDPDLPSDLRDKFRYKLSRLPRNSAFVRVRNRCVFTGRPRAVYKLFHMSRIVFREKASFGALMGVKKSSW